MKKIAFFLAPLMAISFLTNCNSGPKLYTVTFDLNGGTSEAIPTQTVKEGEKATEPKDPSRNEDSQGIYTFKEWQSNGNKFDFTNPITSNITLKAEWNTVHKYTVTFNPNGGKWDDGSADSITQKEKENLALSSIMMTIECGMRFLGDYLSGDTYFHINREGQNLDRARTQFKLVADMEKIFDEMNDLIK